MLNFVFKCLSFIIILILNTSFSSAQSRYTLSTMPRIDVHAHVGSIEKMEGYMEVRKLVNEKLNVNLEMWVDLSSPLGPRGEGADFLKQAEEKFQGRFLPCINDYKIADGLKFPPEELPEWMDRGIVGYKIWVGVSPAVDNPANEPTFTKMEQIGMVGASVHISQPYPRNCKDPIKFWESINAWERVLDRHPELVVVNAHFLDLFYSDEQLEYLQYMLETYPNVYLDTGARFKDFYSMKGENIRNFMIKYSDRILFGTDLINPKRDGKYEPVVEGYDRCFQALETDNILAGGFSSLAHEIKGIALPIDVLEKIYYKNAIKLYPQIKDVLKKLGYAIE
ncbi:amidohydrolase family protein [candidate division KSB1 bacterium]